MGSKLLTTNSEPSYFYARTLVLQIRSTRRDEKPCFASFFPSMTDLRLRGCNQSHHGQLTANIQPQCGQVLLVNRWVTYPQPGTYPSVAAKREGSNPSLLTERILSTPPAPLNHVNSQLLF